MPPLVINSSSSAGRRPCSRSSRSTSASSGPASPRVGAYWNALTSPAAANSWSSAETRSRGNVAGSGKPPAKEIRSGRPRSARTDAIPSPTSPRVRAATSASHRPVSGVTVTLRILRRGLPASRRFSRPSPQVANPLLLAEHRARRRRSKGTASLPPIRGSRGSALLPYGRALLDAALAARDSRADIAVGVQPLPLASDSAICSVRGLRAGGDGRMRSHRRQASASPSATASATSMVSQPSDRSSGVSWAKHSSRYARHCASTRTPFARW